MKKLIGALLALASSVAFSATLNPIQLLNPAGSTPGQAIVSTGASSAPAWGNVTATALAAQAANTVVANFTGSSASPTAFTMPSCSTSSSILQYTSSAGFTCSTSIWASPPAIGGTTPAAGAFTTLSSSSAAKLQYSNSSGQSIPTGAATTITGWTITFDQNLNFNASTGTFTAPATAKYLVSGQITWNIPSGAGALSQYQITVVVNSTTVYSGVYVVGAATGSASIGQIPFSVLTNLTSGNTVVIKATQSSGTAQTINAAGTFNTLSVVQIP